MQFKKLAAVSGSALLAGLSLAAPVLAASVTKLSDISKMVGTTGSTVSYPMFVIGANAATADVAGAVDVAVNLASNAVVTSQVATSGSSVSVTGGVSMATATNPLTMWETFASSKQVLTANDLPDLLASGTFVDGASVSSPYSQYLSFTNNANNGQVVYNTPSGGTQPALGLKFTGGYAVYNYSLAFTKQLSETVASTSVTNLVNTQLNMLGKAWTITSAVAATNSLALTMLAGTNSQTVTTETPVTFNVGSKTYTVDLIAVGTQDGVAAVTVQVSGGNLAAPQTLNIKNGLTQKLSDETMVGVTSIFTTSKTGAIDSATIFVGADKLEITDSDLTSATPESGVKINGQTITDVKVVMTGTASTTAVTLNSIAISWTPSLDKFIQSGQSEADPFTNGAWKIFFGGISPAIDDTANRETVSVTPSGTTAALAFKDAAGTSVNQNFVQYASSAVSLKDAGGYDIHVVEGEVINQNQYAVLGQNSYALNAQNPFGHVVRLLSVGVTPTTTTTLQDMSTGTTLSITGNDTVMYLDGQAYYVHPTNTTAVQITWGASATYASAGTAYDVFPAIQTSKGSWVAITAPATITGLTNNTAYTVNTPTGALNFVTGNAGNSTASLYPAGFAKYNITNPAAGTSLTIRATDNSATVYTNPAIMVVEQAEEGAGATTRNVIALQTSADTTNNRVQLAGAPAFTSTGITTTYTVSGSTQQRYLDEFGAYVVYDGTSPNSFSASLPSSQAQAVMAVGVSPAAAVGGASGSVTTQTVLPITTDVVKLDSEVATADTTNNDVVLVGGPCINSLVAQLADAGKFPYTCATWPGRNFGRVEVIADAFATGKTALVIAGTTAADTDLAAQAVQKSLTGATDAQKAGTAVEITGTVSAPVYA